MRRESAEVSAAARSRLEQLGRELGRARSSEDGEHVLEPGSPGRDGLIEGAGHPRLIPVPGRHAGPALRPGRPGVGLWERWRASGERIAWTPAYLAVVAVVVSGCLGVVAWSALRATPREVPPAQTGAALAPATVASPILVAAAASAGSAATSGPTAEVVVDVAGKVRRPGVATLPVGSRVIDAIRQAGGARRGVDLSTVNLARVLLDGEQIFVGRPPGSAGSPGAPGLPGTSQGAVSGAPGPGALVNLNTATLEELDALPGVGPVTATKIMDWRTEHGSFTAVDELLDVDGIGTKTLAELAPHLTL